MASLLRATIAGASASTTSTQPRLVCRATLPRLPAQRLFNKSYKGACRSKRVGCKAITELAECAAVSDLLFEAGQQADAMVMQQLAGLGPATYAVVVFAGLLTSLSPCTLSVLPLTIGYIGGYSKTTTSSTNMITQAAAFSGGLASTLALLGVASSSLGKAYGQIGDGLPLASSLVAIVMGLNLLEVIQLQLPSLYVDLPQGQLPPALQAYAAGLAFALAASPCSTPVLATLLAYVSSTEDPVQGAALLLAYTSGYIAPLLVAATFTGTLKQLLAFRQYSAWITPASGALLVAGGTYTLLSRLLP